jgi:L-threonylcarbamoyladenylate synthase
MAGSIDGVVAALRSNEPVLLPSDTVYALCASPYAPEAAQRLYAVKGRDFGRPMSIIAASVELLLELVPELRGGSEAVARALLPGPYTLVLPNPVRRFEWLTGTAPETIGVRVTKLPEPVQRVLEAVGAIAATSANEPGEPSPASIDEVPAAIRAGCAAELDVGPLPGTASTVLDFTGDRPAVLREGAGSAAEALARAEEALSRLGPAGPG